jgi:hypothetical protein
VKRRSGQRQARIATGYISSYAEDKLEDAEQRKGFWQRARYRLGKMRLQPNERVLIEQQLAQRVPEP